MDHDTSTAGAPSVTVVLDRPAAARTVVGAELYVQQAALRFALRTGVVMGTLPRR